eukprot:gene56718-biopygen72192
MQENMKTAAKKDQRFLSEAVKGEYRMQSKIYALKDADGNLQTNKSGVHKVLVDEWTKIFTGNASQMSDEFNDKFLQAVEKIDPEKRAQIDADITTEEVMDTLRLLNKDAAATGLAQGDPLSCILALNVVDLVVRTITKFTDGVTLRHRGVPETLTIKALAYVDDCTMFPRNRDALGKIIRILADWERLTGSDGGVLTVPGKDAILTAEAIAMESMLYIGWKVSQQARIDGMIQVSDSKSNVDMVKAVAGGAEWRLTTARTNRQRQLDETAYGIRSNGRGDGHCVTNDQQSSAVQTLKQNGKRVDYYEA